MPIDRAKIKELSQEKVLNLITDLSLKASDEAPIFETPAILPEGGLVFADGPQKGEAVPSRTSIIKKTSNYVLSNLNERDSLIEVSSSSAVSVTIPSDAAVDFPIGTSLDIVQAGYGQVTIVPSTITTAVYSSGGISGTTSLSISAQNLNIEPGQGISGTGISAGTVVSSVSGTTITVDTPFEGQVSGDLAFKVGVFSTPSLKLRTKWSSATLFKRAKNSWVVFGDLALPTPGLPSAPSAPIARSLAEDTNDYVTIHAPLSDGGSAITGYEWQSSDGKSGTRNVAGEFAVAQEAGTSQTYRVRAVNSVGASTWSSSSQSITTTTPTPTFSFAPTFSFSPAGTCTNCSGRQVFSVSSSVCGSSLGYHTVCYNTLTGAECSRTFQCCVGSGC
jgi:hypothetical protein